MKEENQTNNFIEDKCLICYNKVEKIIVLCNNCKYLYCDKCANQIKFLCAICIRSENKVNLQEQYFHPLQNTIYYSIFFFLLSFIIYILIFGFFSYFIFINYSLYYKFLVYIKSIRMIENLSIINQTIIKDNICY